MPVLLMHGDDGQIVPIASSALLGIKLLRHGTLEVYPGFPHGMCTTHADVINADLLAFITGVSEGGGYIHNNRREGCRAAPRQEP